MTTKREQKLLDKLNEQGFLRVEDFKAEFSVNYWRGMIQKFLAMGVMRDSEIVGKFEKN